MITYINIYIHNIVIIITVHVAYFNFTMFISLIICLTTTIIHLLFIFPIIIA